MWGGPPRTAADALVGLRPECFRRAEPGPHRCTGVRRGRGVPWLKYVANFRGRTLAARATLSTLSLYPDPDPESGPKKRRKFYLALACYAVIAVLATLTLDGKFL